jgi:hypothetical protein
MQQSDGTVRNAISSAVPVKGRLTGYIHSTQGSCLPVGHSQSPEFIGFEDVRRSLRYRVVDGNHHCGTVDG